MSLVGAELDRLLSTIHDDDVAETVTQMFERAIRLHRATRVPGYLGAPPSDRRSVSIQRKHLYLCAVTSKETWLLVQNLVADACPVSWRSYDMHPSAWSYYEFAWIHGQLADVASLRAIVQDETVWESYGQMLLALPDLRRSDRLVTLRRLNVLD